MTIAFGYYVLIPASDSDVVVVIFLTLLGMTVVFGFGLWITCKRKFLLLKLYTVVLAAFVLVQIVAVIALATGSGNSDECVFCLYPFRVAHILFRRLRACRPLARVALSLTDPVRVLPRCSVANSILDSVCTAEMATLATARAAGPEKAQAAIAAADENSWFCCCPASCDKTTWGPQMWELGIVPPWDRHNVTAAVPATDAQLADLEAFQWPLLACPTQFAHATESLDSKMASGV